jgi:trimeric autotransporter adhesin
MASSAQVSALGAPCQYRRQHSTAIGAGALLSNTVGEQNTAAGTFALLTNTTGGLNTAVGAAALLNNIAGSQ